MPHSVLPNARPQVFAIPSLDGRKTSYGVRVRLDAASVEITSFRSSHDAWAAGINALVDLIAQAHAH